MRRLWARDAKLWTGHDENRWLDWLDVADLERDAAQVLTTFAGESRRFQHAVVLGMGGSSLCADVLSRTFGRIEGYPELHVLDSTDPAQIRAMEARIDLSKDAVHRLEQVRHHARAQHSQGLLLRSRSPDRRRARGAEALHRRDGPWLPSAEGSPKPEVRARVFFGMRGIGGRYSALSNFGMVPAAVMGVDVTRFLDRVKIMAHACASCVPPEQNPGVLLGTILGTSAQIGP